MIYLNFSHKSFTSSNGVVVVQYIIAMILITQKIFLGWISFMGKNKNKHPILRMLYIILSFVLSLISFDKAFCISSIEDSHDQNVVRI
jgi:hypothetical protein